MKSNRTSSIYKQEKMRPFVDMDTDRDNDKQTELSAVVNYFMEGHSNKLSLQLSRLTVEDPANLEKESENRMWAQWDFSF